MKPAVSARKVRHLRTVLRVSLDASANTRRRERHRQHAFTRPTHNTQKPKTPKPNAAQNHKTNINATHKRKRNARDARPDIHAQIYSYSKSRKFTRRKTFYPAPAENAVLEGEQK